MKESRVKILRLTAWLVASAMFVSLSSEAVVRAPEKKSDRKGTAKDRCDRDKNRRQRQQKHQKNIRLFGFHSMIMMNIVTPIKRITHPILKSILQKL